MSRAMKELNGTPAYETAFPQLPRLDDAAMKRIGELHREEGKFTRLCGSGAKSNTVMGWPLEKLGWEV